MTKLDAAARNALPDSSFAYIDADGGRHLPIHDAGHVRAAMARFDQQQFESESAKDAAHAKIAAAAKRLGIQVQDFTEFAEPPQKDRQGGDDPDMPGDEDDDDDDDEDGLSGFIDSGDVHADAPIGTIPPGPPGAGGQKKSPFGSRLVKRLRDALKTQGALSASDVEGHIASARGHAGGIASGAARKAKQASEPCAACEAGDMASCQCAGCMSGDACTCCEMVRAGEPTPTDPDGDGDDDTTPEGDTDHDYAGANPPRPVPKRAGERVFVTSEAGQRFGLFIAADVTHLGPWIPYLPKPGTFTHPQWGKITLSRERNAEFVRNFKEGVYQTQLPMDAEHQTKLSGALAWIRDMRQNPDGSVDARVEYTERGRQLMANDAYRYVSPEFFEEWTDPATGRTIKNVASGGAFCTRPFFKESSLRPLVAAEGALYIDTPDSSPLQEFTMTQDQTPTTPATEPLGFAELQAELAKQRQMTEAAEARVQQMVEKIEASEKAERLRSFAETARAFTGETEAHVKIMDALPDDLRGEYVTGQRAMAEQINASRLFDQFGRATRGDASAEAQLQAFAEKIVADATAAGKPITLAEGYAAAMAQPRGRELYDLSLAESAR